MLSRLFDAESKSLSIVIISPFIKNRMPIFEIRWLFPKNCLSYPRIQIINVSIRYAFGCQIKPFIVFIKIIDPIKGVAITLFIRLSHIKLLNLKVYSFYSTIFQNQELLFPFLLPYLPYPNSYFFGGSNFLHQNEAFFFPYSSCDFFQQ